MVQSPNIHPFGLTPVSLLLGVALLTGCGQQNEYVEPPPPKVSVAKALQKDVTDYLEFTGTTRAASEVEVRARVKGFLQSMHFTPGQDVEQGDLLFVIDPREFEANLSAAKAELAAAQAEFERAEIELARSQRLFKQKAGSESEVVKWQGEKEVARAAILSAEANIQDAKLNLEYTRVVAPIDGRVSRNLVDPGNLVGQGEATLLATVTDYHPMYAYYNLNERDLLMTMDLLRARVGNQTIARGESGIRKVHIPLSMGLANDEGYPHQGKLDFADSSVDSETGTLQLRGVFDNRERPPKLIPGLFARVRMPIQERKDALLVAARAIGADQGGEYLLVVTANNQVEKRPIVKRQLVDGLFVIKEGLAADDRVVVKGMQRARPGSQVDPQTVEMASLTTSALRAAVQKKDATGSASPEGPNSNDAAGEATNADSAGNHAPKTAAPPEKS